MEEQEEEGGKAKRMGEGRMGIYSEADFFSRVLNS